MVEEPSKKEVKTELILSKKDDSVKSKIINPLKKVTLQVKDQVVLNKEKEKELVKDKKVTKDKDASKVNSKVALHPESRLIKFGLNDDFVADDFNNNDKNNNKIFKINHTNKHSYSNHNHSNSNPSSVSSISNTNPNTLPNSSRNSSGCEKPNDQPAPNEQ